MKNNFKAAACSLSPVSTMHDMPPPPSPRVPQVLDAHACVREDGGRRNDGTKSPVHKCATCERKRGTRTEEGKREARRTQRHTGRGGRDASRGAVQV